MQNITSRDLFHKTTYVSVIVALIVFLAPILFLMLNDNVVERRHDIASVIERVEKENGRDVQS